MLIRHLWFRSNSTITYHEYSHFILQPNQVSRKCEWEGKERDNAIGNKKKEIQKSPVTCEIAIKSEMNSTDGEIVVHQGL